MEWCAVKVLLVYAAALLSGIAIGLLSMAYLPQSGHDRDLGGHNATQRLDTLEREVAALRARRPAAPTHRHWDMLERYLDSYESLTLERLPSQQTAQPELGGEPWGGIIKGATLDLLLAARAAQTLVPVYFDRIAVLDDVAQMTFYVLGAREHGDV